MTQGAWKETDALTLPVKLGRQAHGAAADNQHDNVEGRRCGLSRVPGRHLLSAARALAVSLIAV